MAFSFVLIKYDLLAHNLRKARMIKKSLFEQGYLVQVTNFLYCVYFHFIPQKINIM